MNREKQLEIKKLCPNLHKITLLSDEDFKKLREDTGLYYGISSWGFECEDGWYEIIKDASLKIEQEILKLPEEKRKDFFVVQIKEKFGTLRFYMSQYTDEMDKIIEEAEKKSEVTCEISGNAGELINDSGWFRTLSKEEAEKWKKGRTKFLQSETKS